MSAEPDRDELLDRDPALARALESLPPTRPDPAFEARLRARFLRGEAAAAPEPAPRPVVTRARVRPAAPQRRGAPLRIVAAITTLAAAVLVAFLLRTRMDGGDSWTLLASAPGQVFVDDRPVGVDDAEALRAALETGASVRTDEAAALSLRLGEHLAVHIGPATTVRLPRPRPGRVDAPWELGIESGHLAVATGPGFPGESLRVLSPEVEVSVVGTRFALDVDEEGTCVCCDKGTVEVRSLAHADEHGPVEAGAMVFGLGDGSLKFMDFVVDEHVAPLKAIGECWSGAAR